MPKKWYQYLVTQHDDADQRIGAESATGDAPAYQAQAVEAEAGVAALTGLPSFEDIYAAAKIAPPVHGYSILKVADMLKSEHIASLPPDIKRKSVLLALDAAGVPVQEVVQDAVRRDQALDTFERTQARALAALEATVRADSTTWQEEIDRLIAERQAKIRASNEQLAREAAAVQTWRQRKVMEEARIAEAVSHFVTDNPVSIGTTDPEPTSKI